MTIGDRIKLIAEEKEISFYRIAKDAEISTSYISELISNKKRNPTVDIAKKISKALGVTVEDLIE